MKEKIKEYLPKICIYAIPFFIALLVECFYRIGAKETTFPPINALLFATFLFYILWFFLWGITKKTSIASVLVLAPTALLLIANQFKKAYTGDPIVFSDFNFMSNTGELAEMIKVSLSSVLLKNIWLFLGVIVAFGVLIVLAVKKEMVLSTKMRWTSTLISLILLLLLMFPTTGLSHFYTQVWFRDTNKDYELKIATTSFYRKYGFIAGMYKNMLDNRFEEPLHYVREEVEEILSQVTVEEEEDWGTPNIILVFSESFWDVDQLEEVKFDKPVTSNLHRLQQEGKLVNLISPTYGGASENVAFELLTGASTQPFARGYVPITQLYPKAGSEKFPSIVKLLKENDYYSKIVFGKDYYSSEKSFLKLGFDEYQEVKSPTKEMKKGYYVSDAYLTDLIIQNLEEKEKGQKLFYMTETIQNHMSYVLKKYPEYDIAITESNLSEDLNNTLLSYAQGVYDADKELGRLYDYIQTYEEPTIILFLGDHLPYLNTEKGENVMEHLEYFNTDDELLNLYRKYHTQALVVSNMPLDFSSMPDYLGPDMLFTYIIHRMNIPKSNFYDWLYTTIEYLPASNSFVSQDKAGNLYDTNQLPNDMEEVRKLKEKVQYRYFIEELE